MNPKTAAIFGIANGIDYFPTKQITATQPDGQYYFIMPIKEGYKDIVVALKTENEVDYYLTDKSANLHAAAVLDTTSLRLITNEQAAEKFKAMLRVLAAVAEQLPAPGAVTPSGAAAPSTSPAATGISTARGTPAPAATPAPAKN